MDLVKSQIKNYICTNLMGVDVTDLSDADSLFREKRLDSLSMAELLTFIEDEFSIKVSPLELTFENFDSVNELTKFVLQKKQQ